ncbi:MAG: PAS domain S-box protein [Desulfatitalea sp.]
MTAKTTSKKGTGRAHTSKPSGKPARQTIGVKKSLSPDEEKYRTILTNLEEGYYETDLDGNFTLVNPATCRNLGRDESELLGMNYRQCIAPHTTRKTEEIFQQVLKTGMAAKIFECELVQKDGTLRIHEMSISLVRRPSGDPIGFFGISRDRTDRLQLERALREREESYRGVMDLCPDTITINEVKTGRYVDVNEAFCQQTGFDRDEVIGRTVMDLNLFADPEDRMRLVAALRQRGRVDGMEIVFRTKDGNLLSDLVSARIIQFKNEECVLVIATVINALKEAQKALVESEQRYRTILEAAPDTICLTRLSDGTYIEANSAFYQRSGFTPEETIGHTSADLDIYADPADRARLIAALKQSDQVNGFEVPVKNKDGSITHHLWSCRVIQHNGEPCLLVVAKEIDELKQAQRAREESEEGYRSILDTAPYTVVVTRLSDSRYVRVNQYYCRRTGYSEAETIGHTALELNLFENPADRERMMETLRSKGQVEGMEIRFRAKNGQILESLVSVTPIRYRGDDCMLSMTVDITERKRIEQELERYRQHLEEMVRTRTQALEATQNELVKNEKLAVLGQLTATVSHELRNPLGVIRSSNFFLQRKVKDRDEKIDKHFRRIEEQVALCDTIVADLLEYTRGRSVSMVKEDITPWLTQVIEQIQEAQGITVTQELSRPLPAVPHDQEKMRRVVINVLDNAIQAVRTKPPAAIGERVDYHPKIIVKTHYVHDQVIISIADNGVGMDPATLQRAFEPLFTTRARGTGIGLAIVKKIVNEHAGSVSLKSAVGEGTQVTIALPCVVVVTPKTGAGE